MKDEMLYFGVVRLDENKIAKVLAYSFAELWLDIGIPESLS